MSKIIEVELDEIVRIYRLMANINHFFHQPMNFDETHQFSEKYDKEIIDVLGDVIWHWLPNELKEKMQNE